MKLLRFNSRAVLALACMYATTAHAQGERVVVLGEDPLTGPFVRELLSVGFSPESRSLTVPCSQEAATAYRDSAKAVICVQEDVARISFGEGLLSSRYVRFLRDEASIIAAVEVVRAELLVDRRLPDTAKNRDPLTIGTHGSQTMVASVVSPSPSSPSGMPQAGFEGTAQVFQSQSLGAPSSEDRLISEPIEDRKDKQAKRAISLSADLGAVIHSGSSSSLMHLGVELGWRFGGATSLVLRGAFGYAPSVFGDNMTQLALSPQVRYDFSARPHRYSAWIGAGFSASDVDFRTGGPFTEVYSSRDLAMSIDAAAGGSYWVLPNLALQGKAIASFGNALTYSRPNEVLGSYGPVSVLLTVGAQFRLPY